MNLYVSISTMRLICFFLLYGCNLLIVETTCPTPVKFYIDCSINRTIDDSIQLCKNHQMTLLNLTNSSSLSNDIALLNNTMVSINCSGNFWFLSNNNTAFVDNTNNLQTGFFAFSIIINILACLFGNCPTATTTSTPIIYAITVCTRSIQNNVYQKCPIKTQLNIRTFSYITNNMYTGILYTVTAHSQTACYGICSSDDMCVGATYTKGTCILYL